MTFVRDRQVAWGKGNNLSALKAQDAEKISQKHSHQVAVAVNPSQICPASINLKNKLGGGGRLEQTNSFEYALYRMVGQEGKK